MMPDDFMNLLFGVQYKQNQQMQIPKTPYECKIILSPW